MHRFCQSFLPLLLLVLLAAACNRERVDFSADIKPILNKRCISCHGGVKQSGGFSVLFREEALDTTESGKFAIVPGDPEHSEMIRRITETDPELRMPYKEEPLTQEEIRLLTLWVEQGAPWGQHWAYSPPQPVEVPSTSQLLSGIGGEDKPWARNPIDHFVLSKMAENGLRPSPQARKETLVRRVYLDLIGLPPTPEQARQFLNDGREDVYERLVDELLASPHYGEKWASWWLDLARYADTKGYEADQSRVIWRYRDYVINSFNEDKPFDQFTVEQLAGDMLPDPTDEQMIATAFHRNTMNNSEGGTDDEEFRIAAVMDRVSTTWEVFQSTTMACVQCHSHPYDPIRHEEYYRAFAYFNNTRDEDVSNEHPLLRTYQKEDEKKLDAIRAWVEARGSEAEALKVRRFLKTLEPKYHAHIFDEFVNGELNGHKWLSIRPGGSARMKDVTLNNETHLFINYSTSHKGGSFEIRRDHPDGERIARVSLKKTDGDQIIDVPLKPLRGTYDLYFRFENPNLRKDQSVCVIEWFAFRPDLPGAGEPGFAAVSSDFASLLNTEVARTPVMVEGVGGLRRETRLFERGNWLLPGEKVAPGIPAVLNATEIAAPADRLAFARWLVSKDNPLTARTIVNRYWEQIFGRGLVETLEDFGTQGAPPTHPALLDWLALRFMNEHHWSVKKLLRDIVLSATYRQDAHVSDKALEKDPQNIWLARGARVRLSAEQIRDQALAASGLLSRKMFGESVMPYQPDGIWMSVYSGEKWTKSEGEDQYRRGLYTFIKRTSPYPSMIMFDGSSREVCVGRRIRTNTPLQALVTLNDPVYVEAARALAMRMTAAAGDGIDDRIATGYRLLSFSDIPQQKLDILRRLHDKALAEFQQDTTAAHAFTNDPQGSPELASLTVVANALLNLDEVIMKE